MLIEPGDLVRINPQQSSYSYFEDRPSKDMRNSLAIVLVASDKTCGPVLTRVYLFSPPFDTSWQMRYSFVQYWPSSALEKIS